VAAALDGGVARRALRIVEKSRGTLVAFASDITRPALASAFVAARAVMRARLFGTISARGVVVVVGGALFAGVAGESGGAVAAAVRPARAAVLLAPTR